MVRYSMSAGSRGRARVRRLRELAAASKTYLPLPTGPTPLSGPLEVVDAYLRAWEARDAGALAALFAEDADYVNVVGLWWTSRHSIKRAYKRSFKSEYRAASFEFDKLAFRQLGSDGAVVHARWRLTGQLDPDDKPSDPRRGVMTFALERVQDDTWLIVSAQVTDIVAAADTNVAHDGELTATSYIPQIPQVPGAEIDRAAEALRAGL